MISKRSLEGYLLIDHRYSPGLKPEDVAHMPDAIPVGAGVTFESAIIRCAHCMVSVVLNPDRSRERGHCRKCDAYLCDSCTALLFATGECKPRMKKIEEVYEAAIKGRII